MPTLVLGSFLFALPALAQAPKFELQLVRADAGPVAGAQVRWFEGEAPRGDLGAFEAAALASGKLALADERGRVVIEGARERVNIAASLPGWWGFAFAGEVAPRLALHGDGDLVVHLRDAEGQPVAGVSVEVAFTSNLRRVQRLRSANSDAAGRIVVPHLRAWSGANVEAVSRFERDHRWRLRVDPYKGSALELRVQTLPAAAAPDRLIALPLADEAVTIEGLPVAKVALEVRVGRDVAPFESYRFEELSTKRQFVGEGRWVDGVYTSELSLWPVRIGHDLSFLLRRNALSDRLTAAVKAEDIADDLRARVELGSRAQTWRLRPTRDGAPAANSEFHARIRGRRGALRESVVVTDARGELLIDIYPPDRNGRRLVLSERSEVRRARVGVVDLRDERQALIDVALEPRAEIQIEILDDSGAPVAGAEVATFAYGAFDGLEYGSNASLAPPLKTDELGRAQLFRTDKHYAGVFAWWGRVEVTARGYSLAEASFSERVPDLRLVLDRPAKVLGYLRATDPMDVADINLLLLRREDGVPETQAPGVTLGCSCDGRFEFDELRPAEYTLIVRRIVSFARPVELARREKLVLTTGQVLDLGEIEVR